VKGFLDAKKKFALNDNNTDYWVHLEVLEHPAEFLVGRDLEHPALCPGARFMAAFQQSRLLF